MEGSETIPADSVGQLLYSLGKEYRRDDKQHVPSHTPINAPSWKGHSDPSFKARSHRALVYRRLCMSQWFLQHGKDQMVHASKM